MKTNKKQETGRYERGTRSWSRYPMLIAALAMIVATTAGTVASAVQPKADSWAGPWEIYFAADLDQNIKPGGAKVIWNSEPGAPNEFELKPSKLNFRGLEVYESVPIKNMTRYWTGVQFIRVGSKPLRAPHLKEHPLPVKVPDPKHLVEFGKSIEPIVSAILTGMVQPDTERLIGSFVKDDKAEYFTLYRLHAEPGYGKKSRDLLFIELKDPAIVPGGAFENGWGTGGRH
jgi:hypothetical protein